jgi:chemotaxis protein MotB
VRHKRSPWKQASHERWLVSYADFITLLFAFFVVLYASAEMDRKKVVRLSTAIETGFQHMGVGVHKKPAEYQPATTPAIASEPVSSHALTQRDSDIGAGGVVDAARLQQELEDVLGEEIREHEVEMRMTAEGLVLSLREVGFFDSGKPTLMDSALPKLGKIAAILNRHGLDLRVEGHTDDVPIHNSEFHSNWELSTARATHVVNLLVQNFGLNPLRISAAGYGPYRPVASNDTPQGRRMNRRVDLVITSGPSAASGNGKTPSVAGM